MLIRLGLDTRLFDELDPTNITTVRGLHWLSQLVHDVTNRSYAVLFNENGMYYQAKSFMFYNVQTTYLIFVGKN